MYNHENKLCKTGEQSRALLGQQSRCPHHAEKCTPTRPPSYNMGNEWDGGLRSGQKLLNCEKPVLVNRITTDADGCLAQGMSTTMRQTTESLLDPSHLNRSLCSAVSRENFSKDTFPGNTVREQIKVQHRFADDISHSAQAEADQIFRKYGNDISVVKQMATKAVNVIPKCYMGDHSCCKTLSQVCKGKYKCPYLPRNVRGKMMFTTQDKELLKQLLQTRIGPEAMEKTRYGTSTQKAEST